MEIILIRHGQSEADLLEVHEGRADFPLTELGVTQAKLMAKAVKEQIMPEIILSSPLKRAIKTAEILQAELLCELIEVPDLMEYNNGVLAGLSKEVAATKYPLPKGGRPVHIPVQGGESELEFRFRSEKVFSKIVHEFHTFNKIAIVSHGGTISNMLKAFLKLPATTEMAFATGDTGIHRLSISENVRVIRYLNKQDHLLEL